MSKQFHLPGIPDDRFSREPGVPMTKYEIRVLAISLLDLFPGMVFFDIGAGTGSISIEAKLAMPDSQVFAVEKDPHALQVLKKNCSVFGVSIHIYAGSAPVILDRLPMADRIFVGGSGGDLENMLPALDEKLRPGGCMVINSVTMHSASQSFSILEMLKYDVEARQINVAVSSSRGRSTMWRARNPVTIISGTKGRI